MTRYRVTITGQGYEAMADLVRKHQVDVLHRTTREKAGYQIERHEDVDELGRQRQAEIGQGDRYAQHQLILKGAQSEGLHRRWHRGPSARKRREA